MTASTTAPASISSTTAIFARLGHNAIFVPETVSPAASTTTMLASSSLQTTATTATITTTHHTHKLLPAKWYDASTWMNVATYLLLFYSVISAVALGVMIRSGQLDWWLNWQTFSRLDSDDELDLDAGPIRVSNTGNRNRRGAATAASIVSTGRGSGRRTSSHFSARSERRYGVVMPSLMRFPSSEPEDVDHDADAAS